MNAAVKQVLRDCPNLRLHVLFALFGFRAPVTASDVAQVIPMDRKVAASHLAGLEADGYVARVSGRWLLTDKGKQISLPGTGLIAPPEGGGFPPTVGSSSSLLINSSINNHELPLPENESGVKTPTFPELPDLVELAAVRIGAGRERARVKLNAALEAGAGPEWIELQLALWGWYGLTPKSEGIKFGLAAVALARIAEFVPIEPYTLPFKYHSQEGVELRELERAADCVCGCRYQTDREAREADGSAGGAWAEYIAGRDWERGA
jgi:hypothetical protein